MGCRVRCQSGGGGGGGFTQEQIEDFIGAMLVAGTQTGITVTYDDAGSAVDFVVDTQWTTEQLQDLVGTMNVAGTQTGIAVTYDDVGAAMDYVVSTEFMQDLVGAMAVGGTQTAIAVTYNDVAGTLNFVVTPGAFDIDSFPAASTPLSAGDMFVVSQGGTEGKVAYSDISTGGTSDPYGLLSDGAAVVADEFDNGAIAGAWVQTALPGVGAITWVEGNHRLGGRALGVPVSQGGAILHPLSSFGGAMAVGSIVETSVLWGAPNSVITGRMSFGLSDGTSASSNFISFHREASSNTVYTVEGTIQHPFSVGFVAFGTMPSPELRLRVQMTALNVYHFLFSLDGNNWIDCFDMSGSCTYSPVWTPTHFGLHLQGNGFASMDYVRRIV